ncbi:hypothetical protein ACFQ9Q_17985 [Streptomyces virginiae]
MVAENREIAADAEFVPRAGIAEYSGQTDDDGGDQKDEPEDENHGIAP